MLHDRRSRAIAWVALVLVGLTGQAVAQVPATVTHGADWTVPGEVLVKFKPGMRRSLSDGGVANPVVQQSLLVSAGAQLQRTFAGQRTGVKRTALRQRAAQDTGLDLWYTLRFDARVPVTNVVAQLLSDPALKPYVAAVEPRRIYRTQQLPNDELLDTSVYSPSTYWNLYRTQVPQAWELSQGDTSVVIAVVDDGVQWWHWDFVGNLALNHADPIDGLDNDSNGYVDDYRGWDFVGRSRRAPVGDNDPSSADTMPWRSGSFFWHGTVVASFAASSTNNGQGGASAGWKCRLLPIKVGPDTARADSFAFSPLIYPYEGVVYAADRGAKIINCSWGGRDSSTAMHDVIRYATAQGALVVAAAGNSNNAVPLYPAAFPQVLSVAMTNATDVKVSTSSFGPTIDLTAPGGGPAALPLPWGVYTLGGPIGFATSWASPQVASIAGLLKAYMPGLSPAQLHDRLRATADPIDALNPMHAGQLGSGRVNAYRALAGMTTSAEHDHEAGVAGLRLYPNPAAGAARLEGLRRGDTVQLVDVWGRTVFHQTVDNQLDVSLIAPAAGLYVVHVTRATRHTALKLVVR